jgi:hypothetical protein
MAAKLKLKYAILASVLLASCSALKHSGKAPKLMPGTWQLQPIVIDGDCTDWPSPYPNYDAKAMVAYATSNDAENLYITMQTGDPLTQVKILKRGMTVSIDTSGRKDPTFNINYPLPNERDLADLFTQDDRPSRNGAPQLSRQFSQKLEKEAEEASQFSIDGLGKCNGGYMVSQTIPCGIVVKVRIDEYKQLVWEAVVPFKAIFNKPTIDAYDAGKGLSVCFAVKGFKSASKGNDNSPSTMGNTNMGGSGMGAGGRPNSTPMGASVNSPAKDNPMQRLYESTKTWKHFAIAWK